MGEIFFIGSIFCAILSIYVLIIKDNALKSFSNYLLAVYFIFQIWCTAVYLLIYSGWILNVPHMYKTAAPINFIAPPFIYLYIRTVLFNEKKFKWTDLLHFIPFLVFFINYIPFYILPIKEKYAVVLATTKDFTMAYKYNSGFIPEYVAFLFRPFQAFVYLFFQWSLILKFKKKFDSTQVQQQVKDVLNWLRVFVWSNTIYIIAFVCLILIVVNSNHHFPIGLTSILPGLVIALSMFVISFYLLIHPEVLTGLPFIHYKEIASPLLQNQSDKIAFIREDYQDEIENINQYFAEKQPYLINNISISQVSVVLNIPVRELSYIINNHYGLRFNDFLNKYRIEHIVKNINKSSLDSYTIESIAKQAGFSSKTSFYRAFQKIYQCTPIEYLQNKA